MSLEKEKNEWLFKNCFSHFSVPGLSNTARSEGTRRSQSQERFDQGQVKPTSQIPLLGGQRFHSCVYTGPLSGVNMCSSKQEAGSENLLSGTLLR